MNSSAVTDAEIKNQLIISTEELEKKLGQFKILDASADFARKPDDCPRINFLKSHIKGAQYLDVDYVLDHKNPNPYMLPPTDFFIKVMKQLNIKKSDQVVVYDTWDMNLFGFRAAWMFQAMGHEKVFVLDGGFNKWQKEGRPCEGTDTSATDDDFAYQLDPTKIKLLEEMQNLDTGVTQVIEVRKPDEYEQGHLPDSILFPTMKVMNMQEGQIRDEETVKASMEEAGIDLSKNTVFSCNTGVASTAAYFRAKQILSGEIALYDGSYMEWKAQA